MADGDVVMQHVADCLTARVTDRIACYILPHRTAVAAETDIFGV